MSNYEPDGGDDSESELDPALVERLEELRHVLADVSERLGDVSIDLVRSAIDAGSARPAADKSVARVRRSVDKAIGLLDRMGAG